MSNIHDAPVREEDLQAYVDGMLDINLRASIEAYLALHPEEAERVTAYRAQNVALHQAYDIMIKGPLPVSMERMIEKLAPMNGEQWTRRWLRRTAAAAVLLLAASGGWVAHDRMPELSMHQDPFSAFTRRAIEAHALLTGDQSPPLVEKGVAAGNALVGWLSQRESSSFRSAPDLKAFELFLAGGRIFFIHDQLVVQLIYQGKDGQMSLYVGASPKGNARTTFTFAQQGDISTFYWRQGKFEFSLVSRMQRARLLDIAKVVQNQLGGPVESVTRPASQMQPVSSDKNGAVAPGGSAKVPAELPPQAPARPGGAEPRANSGPPDNRPAVEPATKNHTNSGRI